MDHSLHSHIREGKISPEEIACWYSLTSAERNAIRNTIGLLWELLPAIDKLPMASNLVH